MRKVLALSLLTASVFAQETAKKPSLTAEEIMEKSIEAGGGRARREKNTSSLTKGTLVISAQNIEASMEIYQKAPNKRLMVTTIPGFGEMKTGFDGQVAWSQTPNQEPKELEGPQAANTKREAVFNADLHWRETYSKLELGEMEKSGDREFYVIKATPKEGQARTLYYDAKTFLLDHTEGVVESPQGSVSVKAYMSDYRDVDGLKVPFEMKQALPNTDLTFKLAEIKYNVEIDDTKFAKPAK
jgi:hypothetical protein